jgi:hypothetical protein
LCKDGIEGKRTDFQHVADQVFGSMCAVLILIFGTIVQAESCDELAARLLGEAERDGQ